MYQMESQAFDGIWTKAYRQAQDFQRADEVVGQAHDLKIGRIGVKPARRKMLQGKTGFEFFDEIFAVGAFSVPHN